ncbi:MAG: tyrosine-type recombinase/integrase [Actinomycetota bacterium]
MPTVGELFEEYQEVVLGRVSVGTARGYLSAWRQRVRPTFGATPIGDLTTLDIELAFRRWSGEHSTRIDALSLLSSICRVAIKGKLIDSNPCIGVEHPRIQGRNPAARALSIEGVHKLLALLPQEGPYRRFVLAMLYTGCRLGEVAGMRVGDVDWTTGTILVARTASPGLHGERVIGATKGRRVRIVPMPSPLVELVREASDGRSADDILFPGPRGGYVTSGNLSRGIRWDRIRERVKAFPPEEPPLHWHDLRHTAAVMLFLAGLSAPDVQAVLGHSSLQVTQLYADTRKDAARRAVSALSHFYAPLERSTSGGGEAEKSGQ